MTFKLLGGWLMIDTVVLITVKVGASDAVASELQKVPRVEKVLIVTGPYDVIALAELPAKSDYKPFINAIHEIDGIVRTETCLAI
ncbi:MAG: Lrp/AsnC ligand binding domain-containing protein [Candidatus Thorarchaeota archaeon]